MAYLLADLGGTNLAMGLCDDAGAPLGPVGSVPTLAGREPDVLLSAWTAALLDFAGQTPIRALLMGIPSKEEKGLLVACNNLPTLGGLPLRALLAERMGMPVRLYPDSACYAMGAYQRYGGGRKNVLVITLGTGVGAAWILDGHLYHGNGMTGEMWIAPYQGGNLEDTLSTPGLLSRCPAGSVAALAGRALQGEAAAQAAFTAYGEALGTLLCYAVGLMDPECVLIGGGIAKGYVCFEPAMRRVLRAHTVRGDVPILYCKQDDGRLALTGTYLLNDEWT